MDLVKLSDLVYEYFNTSELKNLCFQLQIDYESLSGNNRRDKTRELTMHCHRHGRVDELIAKCQELRSHVDWEPPEEEFDAPPVDQTGSFASPFPQNDALRVPGMFWMNYPDNWYGPFYGYYIMWLSVGGFQVWDPYRGVIPFPDPYRQTARNAWLRLPNSPFNIYVDGSPAGHVFGQYSP